MPGLITRGLAHAALAGILLMTAGMVHLARAWHRFAGRRREPRPFGQTRVLLVGSFYNENWFRSHALPLSKATGIGRVYVVTDKPFFAMKKIEYVSPSERLRRILGRSLARAWMVTVVAFRERPDYFMGYHIMPNALLCLVAGSWCSGQTIYQMTGGPVQMIGGGFGSENVLLRRLGRHSALLERAMIYIVKLFDCIVVRGEGATRFLRDCGVRSWIVTICGSVDVDRFIPNGHTPTYDLVMVGRHIEEKRPHLFVDLVARLRDVRPGIRAALVGDGPLTPALTDRVVRLGLSEHLAILGQRDDVEEVLAVSRLFVLTSKSEGLSIAMAEAMAAGLPVLAPDVGDLGELLVDQVNGLWIDLNDMESTAHAALALLDDPVRWERMSYAARAAACTRHAPLEIARRWDRLLEQMPGYTRLDSAAGEPASARSLDAA